MRSALVIEPVLRHGANLVRHGHAHFGAATSHTATGIPVHNVALPVIRRPWARFEFAWIIPRW